jgi:DNA-binding transcriptional LysR family regulator
MHLDDPLSLKLFVAVHETGSLAKASERENISPSALSKRMSDLEESLQAILFSRSQRGITLTPAGEALLVHARHIVQSYARMHSEVAEYGEGIRGHVRLLASVTAMMEFVPEDLWDFLRFHPHVKVTVEERVSSDIARAVQNGLVDAGICRDLVAMPELEVEPYASDHLCVVVHQEHPLAQEAGVSLRRALEFEQVGLLLNGSFGPLVDRYAGELAAQVSMRFHTSNFDAALRAIGARVGVGILPMEAVRAQRAAYGLSLVPLLEPWAEQHFVLCARRAESPSPAARALLQHLRARARARTA